MHSQRAGREFTPKYRADIDGLRAVAVLSVVAYHAFPNIAGGGFIGVDIFFVISGFLISSIILEDLGRETFCFREFYSRRIRRIFPALILVLVSCFVFGWFVLLPDEYKQLGKHIGGGAGFVSNLILWNESGYFDSSAESKPLLHLWSLGVEEQFYIFWPMFLFLVWRRINLLVFIAIILLTSFWLNASKVSSDSVGVFYSPLTRFWELLIGALLAYFKIYLAEWLNVGIAFYTKLTNGAWCKVANAVSIIGFLLIAVGVLVLTPNDFFPGWWALLPTMGAVLLIGAGSESWLNRNVLANRVVVWFGLISYPLYLWHWPLLTFARIMESGSPTNSIKFAAVILSIILATLTYKLLERPIRFGSYGARKTIALSLLMLLVGWVGFSTYRNNGFKNRPAFETYEQNRQALVEDVSKHNQENCTASPDYPYQKLNKDFFCMQSSKDKHLPTNVVIGDSHSYPMYFGLYDHYVVQRGERLVLLGAPGCLPFWNIESFEKGTEGRCRKLMETMLEQAESDSQVKTIILVNRGTLYVSGTGYGDVDKHNRIIQRTVMSSTEHNAITYKAALSDTIRDIQSHNKKIILIVSPPELGFEPRSCTKIRPVSISYRNLENCGISYDEYLERSLEYRKIIAEVSENQIGLAVVDPSKSLCNAGFCRAYSKDSFLYSDNNHLSVAGAKKVISEAFLPF